MVADRTVITELATALGTLPCPDLATALASRSPVLRIDRQTWERLQVLYGTGDHRRYFDSAYRNGRAFSQAGDGLAGRAPRIIEWTGGRRPSGDEVAPIDLRIDHVYLISCKYLSANIANPSPARLFDGLLATSGSWERMDWYQMLAPDEYQNLYQACRTATGLDELPDLVTELTTAHRKRLRRALSDREYPKSAQAAYRDLCRAVSSISAERWKARLATIDPERVLLRLLRIGSAPYYLLGAHGSSNTRIRIDTSWDWHHAYRVIRLTVCAAEAGQPRVNWNAEFAPRSTKSAHVIEGHVEVRWSHGRFGQPPEAKIYLDTPIDQLPGYNRLESMTGSLGQGELPFE